MNIDIHHHCVPDTLLDYIRKNQRTTHKEFKIIDGKECLIYTDTQFVQPLYPMYYDYDARIDWMSKANLDMVVLAISPAHFNYELELEVARDTSTIINDWIGKQQEKYPRKIRGMMTLPLQNPAAALSELKRAHMRYKLRGLEIASSVLGKNLDDEAFFPIFDYCAKHKITVCLHPFFSEIDPCFSRYYTTNLVRFMLQTTLGLSSLILGGVLECFPDLNVLAYHGGGYFPYQFGRLVHGYKVRKEVREKITRPPSSFLPQLYFDTITHATAPLQFLVDGYGADHVLIGTDAPYDMGDEQPMESVGKLKLTDKQHKQICQDNAKWLFGIQ